MRRLSALRHIGGSKRRSKANAISMSESKGPMAGVQDFTVGTDESTKDLSLELQSDFATNVILNHDFSDGINFWHPNLCEALLVSGGYDNHSELAGSSKQCYVVVTKRTQPWHGLEQDITARVTPGYNYVVTADVTIGGVVQGPQFVQGTLRLDFENSPTKYIFIGRVSVSNRQWEKINGSFSLASMPKQVVFYLEGPSPGVDLLINYVTIFTPREGKHQEQNAKILKEEDNLIYNSQFEDGLKNWSGRGCKILLHDSMDNGKILPVSGKAFASATERSQNWNGIQQEITGRVQRKLAYDVISVVRIFGSSSANVQATLWVQAPNGREQYIGIAKMQVSETQWVQLHGKFLLNASPSKAVIYLEGPPPGTDILLDSLVVKHAEKPPPSSPPDIENVLFGINLITNSNLTDGLNGWYPLGQCDLSIGDGSPRILPPMAKDSLGTYEPLSGQFILASNRTQTWMGPAQTITDKVKMNITYQLSAWVQISSGESSPQNINIAIGVDGQWFNGGQVDASAGRWHEIGGSFRIEKQPSKIIVYVQGPTSGVDLMVAGLQFFAVDRKARYKYLNHQTDKVRKRDVVLKFSGSGACNLCAAIVKVRQLQNSFPIGSCISRVNIDNEDFVNFFVKNFNWGVFGNELKWYWTEAQQGKLNYADADELLDLCISHGIQTRGHCIFWAVDGNVQSWVKSLSKDDLMEAVQNHLTGLLSRYKGKFRHYDVNNEMLHGSFYQDRLGRDIRPYMFKTAHRLDPSATLFVNDYNVDEGTDPRASPEMYIQQILSLQEEGAQVGGIGIQGHIHSPVGSIVCSALNRLGTLGLPIWFTELDVSAINEYVRADDLEVMLREAYAHPAVEGIMLWGFWELLMGRENAYLVDAEGSVNEAGKRFLDLKHEWLSHAHGLIDDKGEFKFRGFHGMYTVEVITLTKKFSKEFVVDVGNSPIENARGMMMVPEDAHAVNIILNHDFSEGFHYWHPTCCNGHVVSGMSSLVNGVTAYTGQNFAIILNRTESWQGLEQEITAKVSAGLTYTVSAWVRVYGSPEQPIEVQATLKLEFKNSPTRYLSVGRTLATTSQWVKLEGSFSIDKMAKKAIFYLEGPPPKVYLLVDSVTVSPCNRTWHENHVIGVNIIDNSSLHKGLTAWYPLGSCTLKICTGSPHLLPPAVKESLGQHKPLNGHYILTTNRTETWMGPAQTITGRMRLHLTYQVTAWVRVEGTNTPQVVNVALGVDNQWVNGGQIEADGDRWYELSGSFRIEKQPSKVTAYVQGPSPGVNLMVAELHIFPVDRKARFTHLKAQTDKVRKRDVILKISGSYPSHGTVKVRQTINSFPFGSCISRSNIDNEDFVDFFLKNFNWAVFGNELKWYHTEPQQGKLNYADADELLSFCKRHGIKTRGHCIFWEVIDVIQPWVQSLGVTDLMTAVENRLRGLLTRYEGQFKHYDVNNEMLHGTFYKDKLGSDIRAYMFKAANQLDPSAMLFVNDYHVEDGCDSKSCPEKYIHHILDLQKCGAPVGGIGIQGHIKNPVGPVICSALDKLAILNLPIWFTELDVSAENEHLRADDLEVVLREAYAHPAVEGIVLWGFWETFMCTENSHLVGAEGDVNEAGRRYIALREEWMSNADGVIDDHGQFEFRGFHGTYNVEIDTPSKKISKTIVVDKGDSPLLLAIEVE